MGRIQIINLISCLALFHVVYAYYRQKLPMSFDMNTMNEYPSAFTTQGTAVPLMSKVKIVPGIPQVQGSIFLTEKVETIVWEAQFKMKFDQISTESLISGRRWDDLFAIWFLLAQPITDRGNKNQFGYKKVFSGLGMFVYKKDDETYL